MARYLFPAKRGVRTKMGIPAESLGKRIREGEKCKIPYLGVIGDEEVKMGTIAVRNVSTKTQVSAGSDEFQKKISEDILMRSLTGSIGQ